MVPTLIGRIQTRIFTLAVIGSLWMGIITPAVPQNAPISTLYKATFLVLGLVAGIGILWEFVYHGLQQFRWEKDWPILFILLNGINEGAVVWVVVRYALPSSVPKPNISSFLIAYGTAWFVVWLWTVGPMRVPFISWRFRGGRVI